MSVRFSVVIPVYNVAPFLRECLDSLLAQTCADWEAICVDDGSSDGSGEILDEYAAKDSRFRVVHQANSGVGLTRNAALDRLRGKWINYLDADDIMSPRALELFDRGIRENTQADIVVLGYKTLSEEEKPIWGGNDEPEWQELDIGSRVPAVIADQFLWQVSYRADRFGALRFPNLCFGEDAVYCTEVVRKARLAVCGDATAYFYRQRRTSAVHSVRTVKMVLHDICHFREVLAILERSGKTYPRGYWRKMGLRLTQYLAADYAHLSTADRQEVWRAWRPVLGAFANRFGPCGYEKFAAWAVSRTRSLALMWILCYGVHWLKLHGVNRRLARHT